MSVFIEPIKMEKGDPRVTVNGMTVKSDFRIISETGYQIIYKAYEKQERERMDDERSSKPAFALQIVKHRVEFYFKHPFRISKDGYVHVPLLSLNFGSNGFALYILGFASSISWHKHGA